MKVKAIISDYGLTEGKEYKVLGEIIDFYRVRLDNGKIKNMEKSCFEKKILEQITG